MIRHPETTMGEMTAADPADPAEEGPSARQIGRSAVWAGLALSAMLVAILAARSDAGLRRITLALNGAPGPGQFSPLSGGDAMASLPVRDFAMEAETRRLADSVRRLAAERERLVARLETLERSIEVTGSLPPAASQRPPEAPEPPTLNPAPGAGQTPGGPDRVTVGAAASPGVPLPADVPSATIAAEPHSSELAAQQRAAESSISRTEFGIDLGPASNGDALRALWSTVKAQHGALLEGLQPMGVMRETGKPGGAELRLVAGPLVNAAAAARLCAVLAGTGRLCQPSVFDSQRQALR
jgi:hypothetical protein